MRALLFEILIKALRKHLYLGVEPTTKDIEDGFLAQMWESPVFRRRIAERDNKIIFQMAGGEGMEGEPRDKYLMHAGQRAEILLLARDAKAGYMRVAKQRQQNIALTKDSEV
jgi:hypothetical protein